MAKDNLSVATALQAQDASRDVLPVDRMRWAEGQPRTGDLTMLLGLPVATGDQDFLPDLGSIAAFAGARRGKLLLIADSYFAAIVPLFKMQFETVKSITTRVPRETLLKPGLLEAEKPDVVILESVERYWTM